MPLQNRVDPYGAIFRTPARGTIMGNRGGALHNDRREIVRPFKGRRWITCLLEFKERHRSVMSPRRYTELFFLDEAVAFAAGHRPCAECRRERFNFFKRTWMRRGEGILTEPVLAPEIDAELHPARVDSGRKKVTYQTAMESLPNGCFIEMDGGSWLVWDDSIYLWTPDGYTKKERRAHSVLVTVLTPRPIVECFRVGYEPETHGSRRMLGSNGCATM